MVKLTKTEPEISNGDVAFAYLGLLVQGRGDLDHFEPFRENFFLRQSLGIHKVPSSPTLRQRMDMAGQRWIPIVEQETIRLLKDLNLSPSPAIRDLVPVDVDVCPFDNSGTHKEGVSPTYKQVEGYAPIFAYLSRKGVDSSSNPIYAMKTQSSNLSIAGEHGDCNGERTGK